MSEEWTVQGYDPDDVIGYDERADSADLADAVESVTAPLYSSDRTGTIADLLEDELDAVAEGFRSRANREAERFELATNTDFWFCICFATHQQRQAFMDASGWRDLGRRFIDGRALAQRMGIDLPPDPEWPNANRQKSWDTWAMTVEENRSIDPIERG